MTRHQAQARGFCHEAFFYADDDEFLAGAVPFLEAGLTGGEAVIAALPEPRRELLRGALGPLADEMALYPMEDVGRNPGRLISAWRCALQNSAGRRVFAPSANRPTPGAAPPSWKSASATSGWSTWHSRRRRR